jgi:hypothetical protein
MANKDFIWVGGTTLTTNVNRFNFNYSGNWKLRTSVPNTAGTYSYTDTTEIPGPGDRVFIGYSDPVINPAYYNVMEYKFNCVSPLLFGGFTGSVNGGTWSGSINPGGISAWGTTWSSSLLSFQIGALKTNTEILQEKLYKYPFPIIGGGITLSVIETLKGCNIEGMNPTAWDTILNERTPIQEAGLFIKTDDVIIGTPRAKISTQHPTGTTTVWNNYINTDQFKSRAIPDLASTSNLWISCNFIDNYGYKPQIIDTSLSSKQTNSYVMTKATLELYKTKLNIKNSIFYTIKNTLSWIPLKATQSYASEVGPIDNYNTDNLLNFQNCSFYYYNLISIGNNYILHDSSCVYNSFIVNAKEFESGIAVYPAIPGSPRTNDKFIINGELDPYKVYKKLWNKNYPVTGPSLSAFINITVTSKNKNIPPITLGEGLSGSYAETYVNVTGNENNVLQIRGGCYLYDLRINQMILQRDFDFYNNNSVRIIKLTGTNRAIINLNGPGPDFWIFGGIKGVTYSGGINVNTGASIIGSPEVKLLNYSVISGINKRTGRPNIDNSLSIGETPGAPAEEA